MSWATATEKNNDHFTIEKSDDGLAFHAIATVPGAGNSQSAIQYHYTDREATVAASTVYYRLKQTDSNGSSKAFKTVSVNACDDKDNVVKINNSEEGKLSVVFSLQADDHYTLQLYDLMGRQVKTEQLDVSKTYALKTIDTGGLVEGYYMLVLQGTLVNKTQKVFVR